MEIMLLETANLGPMTGNHRLWQRVCKPKGDKLHCLVLMPMRQVATETLGNRLLTVKKHKIIVINE